MKSKEPNLYTDYNTQKPKLILPEYGRNIQIMVEQIKQIEDKEERSRAAQSIINVMGNLNPHLRDVNDFKHKLWDHITIISGFDIDIDSPYPLPNIETFTDKPNRVPYPENHIRYRYFGKIVEHLIQKATTVEDEDAKNILVEQIANHLKKSYLTWNKEVVSDDFIFQVLHELSGGKIGIKRDMRLTDTKEFLKNRKKNLQRKHDNNQGRRHDK
jgi:molybdopterin converting factor small subunit